MPVKITNNATANLSASITTTGITIYVTPSAGGLFPVLVAGDWFPITVIDPSGALEIMRCTARSGDMLTVVRAQEGTTARAFSAGARVELRLTAGAFNAATYGALEDISLKYAILDLCVPVGTLWWWDSPTLALPPGFYVCDGTNGTPDLSDKFIVGAGGSYAHAATGGAASTTLATGNLPAHNHTFTTASAGSHSHDLASGTVSTAAAHTHTVSGTAASGGTHNHDLTVKGVGGTTVGLGYGSDHSSSSMTVSTANDGAHTHTVSGTAAAGGGHSHTLSGTTDTEAAHTHTGTTANTGTGTSFTNLPPYYAAFAIKKMVTALSTL